MPETKPELSQSDKFRELARELEADEDEVRFEEKLRRVVTAPRPEAEKKA